MRFLILLLFSLGLLSAQAAKPIKQMNQLSLIAVKKLGSELLIVSEGNKKSNVKLQWLDEQYNILWTSYLNVERSSSKTNSIRAQIFHSGNKICWYSQEKEQFTLTHIDKRDGSIGSTITLPFNQQEMVVLGQVADSIFTVLPSQDSVILSNVSSANIRYDNVSEWVEMNVNYSNGLQFFTGSYYQKVLYQTNKDHSKILLMMNRVAVDSSTPFALYQEYELELEHHSFTGNSMLDPSLLFVVPSKKGFYLIGKMDRRPAANAVYEKSQETFYGLWIAKFDEQMNFTDFKEISFSSFDGVILNGQLDKAAFIAPVEDINGNLLLNIQEFKYAMYGQRYLLTLDYRMDRMSMIGGKDQYNFFEFDGYGLKYSARDNHLRVINDDWNYYATSALHWQAYLEQFHSAVIYNILQLSQNNSLSRSEESYTFLNMGPGKVLILEYLDKKGGQLNFYSLED